MLELYVAKQYLCVGVDILVELQYVRMDKIHPAVFLCGFSRLLCLALFGLGHRKAKQTQNHCDDDSVFAPYSCADDVYMLFDVFFESHFSCSDDVQR